MRKKSHIMHADEQVSYRVNMCVSNTIGGNEGVKKQV